MNGENEEAQKNKYYVFIVKNNIKPIQSVSKCHQSSIHTDFLDKDLFTFFIVS